MKSKHILSSAVGVVALGCIIYLGYCFFMGIKHSMDRHLEFSSLNRMSWILFSTLNRKDVSALPNGDIAIPKIHSAEKDVLNENGLIIDRWKTPIKIYIQKKDSNRYQIRIWSAGPDKIFETRDDIRMESEYAYPSS